MRFIVTIPDKALTERQVLLCANALLGGVVAMNKLLMRWGLVGPLYKQQPEIRWVRQRGIEEFADALTTSKRGKGDCAPLAAWRAAELQLAQERRAKSGRLKSTEMLPSIVTYIRRKRRPKLVHVQVRRADGRREDPSRFLGMADAEP